MKKIFNFILSAIIVAFIFLALIGLICLIGVLFEAIFPALTLTNIFESGIVGVGILLALSCIVYFIVGIFLFIYKVISTH